MLDYFILIFGGFLSGLLSSLFGLGGSLTTVPALLIVLPFFNVPQDIITHVAISTSLAIMLINSINSARSHHSSGNIQWGYFKKSILLIIVGTIAGTFIASALSSKTLLLLYLIFLVYIILRFLNSEIRKLEKEKEERKIINPNFFKKSFYEIITGIISACVGGGSSLVMVPFLKHQGFKMKQASALSVTYNIFIAFFATANYIILSAGKDSFSKYSTGYIYWPAFLWLLIGSFIGVPIGIKLANKLSEKVQTIFYFLFIVLVFILMLLKYLKA
ncbi:sulfite exporter TauE/SafE family protein [Aureivirga marina]|uniref:sulfite exporter TauE/SafE family protein n=1 Tax=Aureivirga marina TaxID=1182451 RepID=UPI0018CAD6F8|nr:sulfite exporter TauE/SafE family protein [Aureivirga marina]